MWQNDAKIDMRPDGAAASYAPQLDCDDDGNVYVIYGNNTEGPGIFFTRSADFGATWPLSDQKLNTVPAGSTTSSDPRMACSGTVMKLSDI